MRLIMWLVRRFRWVLLGAAARWMTRRVTDREVTATATELEARLPKPVVKTLEAAPGDLVRTGASVMVAQRGLRRAARVPGSARSMMDRSRRLRESVRSETDRERRRLWAETHRAGGDARAADEAMLDRREPAAHVDGMATEIFQAVPDPVPTGRPRLLPGRSGEVDRVQRRYRRPVMPWNR